MNSILLPLLLTSSSVVAYTSDPPNELRLWYPRAATEWPEASPIGNGRLGAMAYGGIQQEHLQPNEDTLWRWRSRP